MARGFHDNVWTKMNPPEALAAQAERDRERREEKPDAYEAAQRRAERNEQVMADLMGKLVTQPLEMKPTGGTGAAKTPLLFLQPSSAR